MKGSGAFLLDSKSAMQTNIVMYAHLQTLFEMLLLIWQFIFYKMSQSKSSIPVMRCAASPRIIELDESCKVIWSNPMPIAGAGRLHQVRDQFYNSLWQFLTTNHVNPTTRLHVLLVQFKQAAGLVTEKYVPFPCWSSSPLKPTCGQRKEWTHQINISGSVRQHAGYTGRDCGHRPIAGPLSPHLRDHEKCCAAFPSNYRHNNGFHLNYHMWKQVLCVAAEFTLRAQS